MAGCTGLNDCGFSKIQNSCFGKFMGHKATQIGVVVISLLALALLGTAIYYAKVGSANPFWNAKNIQIMLAVGAGVVLSIFTYYLGRATHSEVTRPTVSTPILGGNQ